MPCRPSTQSSRDSVSSGARFPTNVMMKMGRSKPWPYVSAESFEVGGQIYEIRSQLLDDLGRQHVLGHVAELDLALLILHSEGDQTVPFRHAERLFAAAAHPKALVTLEGSDHLLLVNRETGPWAGDLIATWARLHLEA